ncbi:MAG: NADH-quinone oxidoreductase subunit J [Acetobacter sp.]|nr:NADH-quinone oxidoreductase subunit J [Acetobacter sp.]
MIAQLFFYIFAGVLLFSAAMVITVRNPVYSVLFLILGFFNAAGLFLIAGAEFLAMLLIIVYVGAIAVLFLFVVMMLDIDFSRLREGFQKYAFFGLCLGLVLLLELCMALSHWKMIPPASVVSLTANVQHLSNTEALGTLVYTHYVLLFQACGIVLLVAMMGAITLTLRDHSTSRRQNIARQHNRKSADTLELVTVRLGESVIEHGGILRPKGSYDEIAAPGSYGVEESKCLYKEEKGE